jgi:hypothetical protein
MLSNEWKNSQTVTLQRLYNRVAVRCCRRGARTRKAISEHYRNDSAMNTLGVAIVCTLRGLPNLTTPRKSRTVHHPCREPLQFRGFALVQSCAVWHDKVCQALADLTVPELFTTSLLLPDLLHF